MAQERPTVKTPLFRGSYVHLIKPRKNKDEPDKPGTYQMLVVLKKSEPTTKAFIKELLALIQKASAEKHGTALPPKKLKHFPIKDGDTFENEAFQGHWCIRVASNYRPNVCDASGETLETEAEVYSGAWYKAKLSAWGWINPKSGKGVSINIESAIKVKDDTRFGGGSAAKDDFAEDVTESAKGDSDDDLDGLGESDDEDASDLGL